MSRFTHVALISALGLAVPMLAWSAEPQRGRSDPQGRYDDYNRDGRSLPPWTNDRAYGRADSGYRNGIDDGYAAGLNDARGRRRYDPVGERRYRSADHGYERWYGSRDAYKDRYREGFRRGYEQGYREGRRYDGRDRGGFFGFLF